MQTYRILLADDHRMFRSGLCKILSERSDFEIVGEAGDGIELLRRLGKLTPDLVILDISMPKMRGIEATSEIKASNGDVKVLILTMHKDIDYLQSAINAGADGYLLKADGCGSI
jgi:DNA-binding NarL/FixJ family response regulator